MKPQIESAPLAYTLIRRDERNADYIAQNPHAAAPQAWFTVDRFKIDATTEASDVHVDVNGKFGYFYITNEANGGFTVYEIRLADFVLTHASAHKQFESPIDAYKTVRALAEGKFTSDLVREAHRKGKGRNAAEITLFKRDRSRSDTLVEYRNRMRARQLPIKANKQWRFFVDLIERDELPAAAIECVLSYAQEMEAVKQGTEGDANFDAKELGIRFCANAVEPGPAE